MALVMWLWEVEVQECGRDRRLIRMGSHVDRGKADTKEHVESWWKSYR